MISILKLVGEASAQGRRRVMSGGAPPANITPPTIAGTVGIGLSLTLTPGTWTGSPSLTYTLLRDGVPVAGLTGVSEATIDAYLAALTADDVGPELDVLEEDSVSATDAMTPTPLVWDDAARAPNTAILISDEGRTDVSGAADSWASTYGGLSVTIVALSSGQRPAVNLTGGVGGLVLINWDGVDDVMKGVMSAKGSSYSTAELGVVGSRVSYASSGDFWMQYEETATGAKLFGIADSSSTRWRLNSNVDVISTTDPSSTIAHYSGSMTAGAYALRKNGTTENTGTGAFTTQSDGQRLAIGGRTVTGAYANIAIQAAHLGAQQTSTERAEIRAFLTYKTGIAA